MNHPPLDHDYLESLFSSDRAAIFSLVNDLVVATRSLLDALALAILALSPAGLRSIHELRGVCANAGAIELAELSRTLEVAIHREDWPGARSALQDLEDAHVRLVATARALR